MHLLVVDAHPGARPLPAYSRKIELRLFEGMTSDGPVGDELADRLVAFVTECRDLAVDQGVEDLMGFGTSAIREAPDGDDVLARVRRSTGVDLAVLSGRDEARLTFLAVCRWSGWSSGRLLVADIGGGSLELAAGLDEELDVALSLPLGEGRLTRELLTGDPPSTASIATARARIRAELARKLRPLVAVPTPDRVVGTSKTLRSLGRIAGAAPSTDGPYVARELTREHISDLVQRLAGLILRPLDLLGD